MLHSLSSPRAVSFSFLFSFSSLTFSHFITSFPFSYLQTGGRVPLLDSYRVAGPRYSAATAAWC